ncbi:hypothetical protein AB1N83_011703 [Pleurotus pulmonarius]
MRAIGPAAANSLFLSRVYLGININSNRYDAAQRPPRQLESPVLEARIFPVNGARISNAKSPLWRVTRLLCSVSLTVYLSKFGRSITQDNVFLGVLLVAAINRNREDVQSIMLKIILMLPHLCLVVPSTCRRYRSVHFLIFSSCSKPAVFLPPTQRRYTLRYVAIPGPRLSFSRDERRALDDDDARRGRQG